MNEEEKKAIIVLDELLLQRKKEKIEITTYDLFENIEIVLNLARKQQKEIESLKKDKEILYGVIDELKGE